MFAYPGCFAARIYATITFNTVMLPERGSRPAMDDTEQTQLPDESEEQIIPLDDAPALSEHSRGSQWLAKKFTPRQRTFALRISVIFSLLLLIILVIPASIPVVENFTTQLYNRIVPPPLPKLAPGEDSFYFDVNVPWEAVTIDDHSTAIPRIGIDRPVVLARGTHFIAWRADPFQEQECTVSVPPALHDTCVSETDELVGLRHVPKAQLLALHESISTEPPPQYSELIRAVQQALSRQDASTIVQPGEMYFGPKGNTTALEPLRATLRFNLDMNASGPLMIGRNDAHGINGMQIYSIATQDCQILCSLPWNLWQSKPPLPPSSSIPVLPPHAITPTWYVLAFASESWDYATMQGNIVANGIQASYSAISHPVLLGIVWDGTHWYVNADFQQDVVPYYYAGQSYLTQGPPIVIDPACAVAQDDFSTMSGLLTHVRYFSDTNAADGCLIIGTTDPASQLQVSLPSTLQYLYRFGVYDALNNATWKFAPNYPQANTYEQQFAQQLVKLPGVTINLA